MDLSKKLENSHLKKGGWKCYCCGPKDKKEKRLIRKKARKQLNNEVIVYVRMFY